MGVSSAVPMVRCRLDGEAQTPDRALRYIPLSEFELWRFLMETRHHRSITIEVVSIWVPEEAARWNSGYTAEELEPVLRVRFVRRGALGGAPVPITRYFPAETYPEAQEALLNHFDETTCQRVDATAGYFVPAREREPELTASVA